jgi:glyoxylase I family protein
MNEIQGLQHVALTVTNLDLSVRWYCDVLGVEVAFREDDEDRHAAVLGFPSGRPVLGLVQHDAGEDRFDPTRVGLDHLAFKVTSRDALAAWEVRLTELGVEHSPAIDVPPGAILNLKDPDGVALALFWDRGD